MQSLQAPCSLPSPAFAQACSLPLHLTTGLLSDYWTQQPSGGFLFQEAWIYLMTSPLPHKLATTQPSPVTLSSHIPQAPLPASAAYRPVREFRAHCSQVCVFPEPHAPGPRRTNGRLDREATFTAGPGRVLSLRQHYPALSPCHNEETGFERSSVGNKKHN
jgi:hypothetical protein